LQALLKQERHDRSVEVAQLQDQLRDHELRARLRERTLQDGKHEIVKATDTAKHLEGELAIARDKIAELSSKLAIALTGSTLPRPPRPKLPLLNLSRELLYPELCEEEARGEHAVLQQQQQLSPMTSASSSCISGDDSDCDTIGATHQTHQQSGSDADREDVVVNPAGTPNVVPESSRCFDNSSDEHHIASSETVAANESDTCMSQRAESVTSCPEFAPDVNDLPKQISNQLEHPAEVMESIPMKVDTPTGVGTADGVAVECSTDVGSEDGDANEERDGHSSHKG